MENTPQQDKLYYSIGEVADMLGVNQSLIRFWEKEFSVIKPKKNRKGNRLFTKKDIENLKRVYFLVKEKGYTLEGAKNILKNKKQEADKDFQVIESLKNLKGFLLEIKNELSK